MVLVNKWYLLVKNGPHVGLSGSSWKQFRDAGGSHAARVPAAPTCPLGLLLASSSTSSPPVLWALFPITLPTQCLPRQGHERAESAEVLLCKLERHSGAETWGLDTNGENHALPLLFIPFLGYKMEWMVHRVRPYRRRQGSGGV